MVETLTFAQIAALCSSREVDLVLAAPPTGFTLCLRGELDGSNFFTMSARDVEYVDLAGGLTVGDMRMTSELSSLATLASKWAHVAASFSGPAIVIRSADSEAWETARAQDLQLIVANEWRFCALDGWRRAVGRGAG